MAVKTSVGSTHQFNASTFESKEVDTAVPQQHALIHFWLDCANFFLNILPVVIPLLILLTTGSSHQKLVLHDVRNFWSFKEV